jgi:hypothetical protein
VSSFPPQEKDARIKSAHDETGAIEFITRGLDPRVLFAIPTKDAPVEPGHDEVSASHNGNGARN